MERMMKAKGEANDAVENKDMENRRKKFQVNIFYMKFGTATSLVVTVLKKTFCFNIITFESKSVRYFFSNL